jgi:hypothetical protein
VAFDLAPVEWALAWAIVLGGTILQGSIGFGVALVAAPLLYLIHPGFVPGPMIVAGLFVPALILWRERRGVEGADVARVVPGTVAGTAVAAAVIGWVSEDALGLLFGALVLLAVGLSLGPRPPVPGRRLLFAAGGLAGFMAATTSIGGPPLALAFQDRAGTRLRGTLSACFVPLGVLSLLALYLGGRLGGPEIAAGAALLPAVLVGFLVSGRTARALDRAWLRAGVLAVSALAGVVAIARAVV